MPLHQFCVAYPCRCGWNQAISLIPLASVLCRMPRSVWLESSHLSGASPSPGLIVPCVACLDLCMARTKSSLWCLSISLCCIPLPLPQFCVAYPCLCGWNQAISLVPLPQFCVAYPCLCGWNQAISLIPLPQFCVAYPGPCMAGIKPSLSYLYLSSVLHAPVCVWPELSHLSDTSTSVRELSHLFLMPLPQFCV